MAYYRTSRKGGVNPDTESFDDTEIARADSEKPLQMRALRVWTVERAIAGMQAVYEDGETIVEAEVHKGGDDAWQQVCRTIFLEDGEYFTHISIKTGGMHFSILNYIYLQTNKERSYEFGDVFAPSQHSIEIPNGHCIVAFHGGMGGHLHNLGAVTRLWVNSKVYFYVKKGEGKRGKEVFGSNAEGTLFGEGLRKEDESRGSISKIVAKYNNSSLCVLDVSYRIFGRNKTLSTGSSESTTVSTIRLSPNEDITGLSGRCGNFINAIDLQTTEKTYKTGTTSGFKSSILIPPGHIITGLIPGYNGKIQCLTVYHKEKPSLISPSGPHNLFEEWKTAGGELQYSKLCDDTKKVKERTGVRLHSVTIYHSSSCVFGFGNTFLVEGKPVKCKHYFGPGYSQGAGHQRSKVRLSPGEFITAINVKLQDGVDGLQVLTTYNQVLNFGNTSAPLHSIRIPSGHIISALAGGIADPKKDPVNDPSYSKLHFLKVYHGLLRMYDNFLPIFGSLETGVEYRKSQYIGEIDENEAFSDVTALEGVNSARLAVVSFHWVNGHLSTLKSRYLLQGVVTPACDSVLESVFAEGKPIVDHLILAPNEFITSLDAQWAGKQISFLRAGTNKRRKFMEFGSLDVGKHMEQVRVEGGVAGFGAEKTSEGLSLFAWTRPLPEVAYSY